MNSTEDVGSDRRPRKSVRELRRFGLIMAVPLAALGGLAVWRGRAWGPYALGLAAAFLLCGLIAPRILGPVERAWMAFAKVMSIVMTFVILTLTYYLVITPVGLVVRLTGKDSLQLRRSRKRISFWEAVDPDGPCGRPFRPY